jgi:hypothetical protein
MNIKPTIGRKIYYHPVAGEAGSNGVAFNKGDQPFDATIVYVHGNGSVNLRVTDHNGDTFAKRNVRLIQAGEKAPTEGGYAQWMEYQMRKAGEDHLKNDLGMGEKAASLKAASGQLGDDRTSTEGEPQRGDPADPDPRVPPKVEHISADVSGRVNSGLPADKTEAEKQQEEQANKGSDESKDESKSTSKKAESKVSSSLQKKK